MQKGNGTPIPHIFLLSGLEQNSYHPLVNPLRKSFHLQCYLNHLLKFPSYYLPQKRWNLTTTTPSWLSDLFLAIDFVAK